MKLMHFAPFSWTSRRRMTPTFLAIGHVGYDVSKNGYAIGGSAAYSAITARNLRCRAGAVTSVGADFDRNTPILSGIEVAYQESSDTTIFDNFYAEDGKRQQSILALAGKLRPGHVTEDWKEVEIVFLCPIANEVDPDCIHSFPRALVGVTPQGWMRQWGNDRRIHPRRWDSAAAILPHADVLVLSHEDLSFYPDELEKYVGLTPIVVLTKGKYGATLYQNGRTLASDAYPANEVDPTGAGDVFAAAFLIEYYKTQLAHKALNFAQCVASFTVEGKHTTSIPTLGAVHARLRTIS